MRVTLMAMLGRVRIPLQVDIGAGDAVVPEPDTIDYPRSTRSSACPRACLSTENVYRREDRSDGSSRPGEQTRS